MRAADGIRRLARCSVVAAACFGALMTALALFGFPRPLARWLCAREAASNRAPDWIVVLGGGGIPSESGLMRTYAAAAYARLRTGAVIVVSLPAEGDPETNSVGRMKRELVMRGLPAERIRMEYRARDTHEQALALAAMLGTNALERPVALVSSSFHLRRALLSFRKAGFRDVIVVPTDAKPHEGDPGPGARWRYGVWENLAASILYTRELVGLAWYKLRGWI